MARQAGMRTGGGRISIGPSIRPGKKKRPLVEVIKEARRAGIFVGRIRRVSINGKVLAKQSGAFYHPQDVLLIELRY